MYLFFSGYFFIYFSDNGSEVINVFLIFFGNIVFEFVIIVVFDVNVFCEVVSGVIFIFLIGFGCNKNYNYNWNGLL